MERPIAWAPKISESFGIANAMEIGIACATFGLILASLMGGPIAKFLINRHKLVPAVVEAQDVGSSADPQQNVGMSYQDVLDAVLAIHICIVLGLLLNNWSRTFGLDLPLFVTCLFAGIL